MPSQTVKSEITPNKEDECHSQTRLPTGHEDGFVRLDIRHVGFLQIAASKHNSPETVNGH